jgi:predicted RNase H-like nuclease (RuvC/YqgF family)
MTVSPERSVIPIFYCSRYQKTMKSVTQKLALRLQDIHSEVSALRKENRELKSCLQKVKDEVAAYKSSQKNDT